MNKILIYLFLSVITNFDLCPQINGVLDHYNFNSNDKNVVQLSGELNEISGLAFNGSTGVITHNDEYGIIFFVDLISGKIRNKISISSSIIKEDFEGIARFNKYIFLLTSEGKLYTLLIENENPFKVKITKLSKIKYTGRFDFEGLCYDPVSKMLLLANKIGLSKSKKNEKSIFSYDPATFKFSDKPFINISISELKQRFQIKNFSPTAIEVHPLNKNLIILSSDEKCIVEISRDGKILDAVKLNGKEHPQPEGLTFLEDYTMIISDEASGFKPQLTIIPFVK